MRTKKELKEYWESGDVEQTEFRLAESFLEVLIDIRDVLIEKNDFRNDPTYIVMDEANKRLVRGWFKKNKHD